MCRKLRSERKWEIKILRREEFKTEGAPAVVLEKFAEICERFLSEHDGEVFGGIFMRAADLIEPCMTQVMKHECLPDALNHCRVVPAGLGENIGDYAALALAVQAGEKKK